MNIEQQTYGIVQLHC